VKKKQKKNLSYRDISYRQKETIEGGGEMRELPTELDDIMKEYGSQGMVNDDDMNLKQSVQKLIDPVLEAQAEDLQQVSRTAKILQRTINRKLNPLKRNKLTRGDSFVSIKSGTSSTQSRSVLPKLPDLKEKSVKELPFMIFPKDKETSMTPSGRKDVENLSYWFGMTLLKVVSNNQLKDSERLQ